MKIFNWDKKKNYIGAENFPDDLSEKIKLASILNGRNWSKM